MQSQGACGERDWTTREGRRGSPRGEAARQLRGHHAGAAEFSIGVAASAEHRRRRYDRHDDDGLHDRRDAGRVSAHGEARRRADRRGRLGGIGRADVSRCVDRTLGEVRSAGARHAVGLRAQPAARLGLVRLAARRRRAGCAERGPRGARADGVERPRVPARHAERRRTARARGKPQPRRAARQHRARALLARGPHRTALGRADRRAAAAMPGRATRSCGRTSSGSRRCCPRAPSSAREAAARECDVLIVAGTSGEVYPAAALPRHARAGGARVVEINPNPTPLSELADDTLRGASATVLPALVAAAWPRR